MHQPSDEQLPPVVMLGLSATALAVARALSPHSVRVYGVDKEPGELARYSRLVACPPFGYCASGPVLLEGLLAFAHAAAVKPVLIVTSDVFIEWVLENETLLRPHYAFQSSYTMGRAESFLNKRLFYQLCEKHGVAFPKTRYLAGGERADDLLREFRLPVIVKPDLIHRWKKHLRGRKVVLIETAEDMRKVFAEQHGLLAESMLQEVVPGPERDIWIWKGYFGERAGRCTGDFVGRKLRQCPPMFGSASFAESIENVEVRRLSARFLSACDFRGLCGTEFKFDARDNQYKMIEVNIRPQLWDDLMRVSDRSLIWMQYRDLAGLPPEPLPAQRYGVTWAYLVRDVVSAAYFMRRGELTFADWLRPYRRIGCSAAIDWRDPLATLVMPLVALRQAVKYMRGR